MEERIEKLLAAAGFPTDPSQIIGRLVALTYLEKESQNQGDEYAPETTVITKITGLRFFWGSKQEREDGESYSLLLLCDIDYENGPMFFYSSSGERYWTIQVPDETTLTAKII